MFFGTMAMPPAIVLVGSGSALGLANGAVPDSAFFASSCWDGDDTHSARRSRLTGSPPGGAFSWCAAKNEPDQYVGLDLGRLQHITGVQTQGRGDLGQWVTKYRLWCSTNGVDFVQVWGPDGGDFPGNTDQHSIVVHRNFPPVLARYVRLNPIAWHAHISLRWELEGVPADCAHSSKHQEWMDDPFNRRAIKLDHIAAARALGCATGTIPGGAFSASSCWSHDDSHSARRARLYTRELSGASAWCAAANDGQQWLQIDLGGPTVVRELLVQGRGDCEQWVTRYRIFASMDDLAGRTRSFVEVSPGAMLSFPGALSSDGVTSNSLFRPFCARVIRIVPTAFHGHISMRCEVVGTPLPAADATNPTI